MSSDFVYPYSTQFIARLKSIQHARRQREDLTEWKSEDVVEARARPGRVMSFTRSEVLPRQSSGVVIAGATVSPALTRSLSRSRERRSKSTGRSGVAGREERGRERVSERVSEWERDGRSRSRSRGRRRSHSGSGNGGMFSRSGSAVGFGSSTPLDRLQPPKPAGSPMSDVESRPRRGRSATRGDRRAALTARSRSDSVSSTNSSHLSRKGSRASLTGPASDPKRQSLLSSPKGFGSSTGTHRQPPRGDVPVRRGRSSSGSDWALMMGSTSSSRNKTRSKSKERSGGEINKSSKPRKKLAHERREHRPEALEDQNPTWPQEATERLPHQSTTDFILHSNHGSTSDAGVPSHFTVADVLDDPGGQDVEDSYFGRWEREQSSPLRHSQQQEEHEYFPQDIAVVSSSIDEPLLSASQPPNALLHQQEYGTYENNFLIDKAASREAAPPNEDIHFLDLSHILQDMVEIPDTTNLASPPESPGAQKKLYRTNSAAEEATLLREIDRLEKSKQGKTDSKRSRANTDNSIKSQSSQHTRHSDSSEHSSRVDTITSTIPVSLSPEPENQILVLTCKYTNDLVEWSQRLAVIRSSSTLEELARALTRQFEHLLPEPDFDLEVSSPTAPTQYFSRVMERVGDRLADSLVPLPRLREDSCLSIRPCSDLSSELGDVGIANNDIRNEHPLDVNNESQCSPETEQGHEHGNEYGHGHDTASDLSDDVEENVGNLSFYDSYDLGEVLGKGSYSTVHRATQRKTGKSVAVKCIVLDTMSDDEQQQLYHEVDILRSVDHPNVLEFYGFFMEEGSNPIEGEMGSSHPIDTYKQQKMYYLVLELLEGGELFDRIIQKSSYNEGDARDVMFRLLSTVAYLHAQHVVHRDLKPENLLLEDGQDDKSIKIGDFGLAEVTDGYVSLKIPCGTPGYAAPEVMNNMKYGKACDMWSVGVIMYVLLGGYPPFNADNYVASITEAPVFQSDPWDGISLEAQDLIKKLLVVEPLERFTAEEALRHPWMSRSSEDLASTELSTTLANLRKFHRLRKFKGAVKAVIAVNHMRDIAKVMAKSSPVLDKGITSSYVEGKQQTRQHSSNQQPPKKYNNVYSSHVAAGSDIHSPQHNQQVQGGMDNLFAILGTSHEDETTKDLTLEDLGSVLSGGREFHSPPNSDDDEIPIRGNNGRGRGARVPVGGGPAGRKIRRDGNRPAGGGGQVRGGGIGGGANLRQEQQTRLHNHLPQPYGRKKNVVQTLPPPQLLPNQKSPPKSRKGITNEFAHQQTHPRPRTNKVVGQSGGAIGRR